MVDCKKYLRVEERGEKIGKRGDRGEERENEGKEEGCSF